MNPYKYIKNYVSTILDDHLLQHSISITSITTALRGSSAILSFGVSLLLAKLTGTKGAGIFFLAMTFANTLSTLGRLGLDQAVLKMTSIYCGNNDWWSIKKLHRTGIAITILGTAFFSIASYTLAPVIATHAFSDPELTFPLKLASLSTVPAAIVILCSNFLKGLKKLIQAAVYEFIASPLLLLIFLYPAVHFYGSTGAVGTIAFVAFIAAACSMAACRNATKRHSEGAGSFRFQDLKQSCPTFYSIVLLNLILTTADTYIVGIFMDVEAIGIYSIANRLAMITSLILVGARGVASAHFAKLGAQQDTVRLEKLALNITKFLIIAALPIVCVLTIFPHQILTLFGPEFTAGTTALRILAIGQLFVVATGPCGVLLLMTGKERMERINTLACGILNIILNLTLITPFGINGVAIGTATSVIIMNIVTSIFIFRSYGIIIIPGLRKIIQFAQIR